MRSLRIGKDGFELPLELASGSIGILAIKGSGKTYTSAVLCEELLECGVPVVILDPVGVHWGLKSSADGSRPGYPVVIFGGDHADLPLDDGAGEVLARAIVQRRFSAIIDMSAFRKAQVYRFLTPFLEMLYQLNRESLHLVCDEADSYAPQKARPDSARCLGAMEDIVRRGRARGLGSTLISQRPASINKDVLTQCDCLFAMRVSHPRDVAPLVEWVNVDSSRRAADKMVDGLASLPTGTAWVWAPHFDVFRLVQIRARTTFDSSVTPKIGQIRALPKAVSKIDLDVLRTEMEDVVRRAEADDPVALRRKISDLERELVKASAAVPARKTEVQEVPVLTEADRTVLRDLILDLAQTLNRLETLDETLRGVVKEVGCGREVFSKALDQVQAVMRKVTLTSATKGAFSHPAQEVPAGGVSTSRTVSGRLPLKSGGHPAFKGDLNRQHQRILDTVAMLGIRRIESNRKSVARWIGIHPKGGTYNTNLGFLRSNGYLEGFDLTEKGLETAESCPTTGFNAALDPLDNGERRIMETLYGGGKGFFTRVSLAEALGIHPKGGTYNTSLGRLRTMGLITSGSEIRLTAGATA